MSRNTTARRPLANKRWAKVAALGVTALVGFTLGALAGGNQPPVSVTDRLAQAQRASATPCWVEWSASTPNVHGAPAKVGDTGPASWEILCGR